MPLVCIQVIRCIVAMMTCATLAPCSMLCHVMPLWPVWQFQFSPWAPDYLYIKSCNGATDNGHKILNYEIQRNKSIKIVIDSGLG